MKQQEIEFKEANLQAAARAYERACVAAAKAYCAAAVVILGPGYYIAEEKQASGEWCSFAGGPAGFVVSPPDPQRGAVRYRRRTGD